MDSDFSICGCCPELTDTALEEKMTRVAAILPSLSGLSGELHMEDYKDGDSSFVFSKDV